jgi:hypothetical protein
MFVAPMLAEGWQDHYLKHTRDQFISTAYHQIVINFLCGETANVIAFQPENAEANGRIMGIDNQRLRQYLDLIKAKQRMDNNATSLTQSVMAKMAQQNENKSALEFILPQLEVGDPSHLYHF